MSLRIHALAIPYPLESHSFSMADLCIKLASRGLVITFVSTEGSSDSQAYINNVAQTTGLDIRCAEISDNLAMDFDRSLYNERFLQFTLNTMMQPVDEVIERLNTQEDNQISCIIADSFLPWTVLIAKKFNVPLISLWTQSAASYIIYYHSDMLISKGHFPSKTHVEADDKFIDYIPGVPAMSPTDLPSFLQATEMSNFMLHVIFLSFQCVREADWVLTNSVYELEREEIQYSMQTTTPLCSVGPLLPSGYFDSHEALDSDLERWLDSKPRHSVIYVSLGECARVSESQIEEIAVGLLESRIPFFWALPPETVNSAASLSEILPAGFLDQIKDKGVVSSDWSRHHHLALLSHRSVGGFFTPCDWNSVLQGLCNGVPLLGFPLHADQYTNCKLVSDEMGIAMKVRHSGIEGETIGRKEIARNVKALMRGGEGKKVRKNMKRFKRVATKATIEGGSSAGNLDNFVEELVDKIMLG